MEPTPENWMGQNNKKLTFDNGLLAQPEGSGVLERSWNLSITHHREYVSLKKRTSHSGDYGLWVPYATGKAVVGYASGGQKWVASGPYSGCEFAIGRKGDRVFAAHIARESGSSGVQDWKSYVETNNLKIWYWNKIPLPSDKFYACSYIFAAVGKESVQSLVRVDVKVTTMGGGAGTIFNVKKFK